MAQTPCSSDKDAPFRVLIVDDDEDSSRQIEDALLRSSLGACLQCDREELLRGAMRRIRQSRYDIILIDTGLADLPSPDAIKELRDAFAYSPIIALSKYPDDELALEWVKAGADDCLFSGVLNERILARVVHYAIERAGTYHKLHKRSQTRHILNALLRLSLQDLPLETLLQSALGIIISAPFTSIQRKGGIFLADNENRSLTLTAQRNLDPSVQSTCNNVRFGHCLCGRAASSRSLIHSDHIDERHDTTVNLEVPHGHYCVPIVSRDTLLGVIVLYLNEGHGAAGDELDFLNGVSDTLAGIIERTRTQDRLTRIHRQNSRLLGAISSVLIGVDERDCVTHWNHAAEACFGLSADQVLGKPIINSGIDWDWAQISLNILECLDGNSATGRFEVRFRPQGGHSGLLNVAATPFTDADGRLTGYLLIADDVTEQKDTESRMQQVEKLQSIGQLAAGIAHEINTPIQYVGDNLRFLQDSFGDLEELVNDGMATLRDCAEGRIDAQKLQSVLHEAEEVDLEFLMEETPNAIAQSQEGVDRVTSIVRAMKDFSHPGSEEKTSVDINRAISSTITVSRNVWKYSSDLETDLDPGLPPVPCLAGPFNEVILNILVNAAHAVADSIGDRPDAKGMIRVQTRRNGSHAEIRISDSGTGIPEDARPYIFDPFFTTKEVGQGTGQGLSLCHFIVVDKHGGDIGFETEIGKGTTFIIQLPLEETD